MPPPLAQPLKFLQVTLYRKVRFFYHFPAVTAKFNNV